MRTCHAFSLAELLVVIAVISVLAALLLPTLEQSLEQSRRMGCLVNQRQLYVAAVQYAADCSGWAPGGTNPSRGSLPMSSLYWGRFGEYWNGYFGIGVNASIRFSSLPMVLLCPSGTRTAYTNASASNSVLLANLGWQKTVDYAIVGGAPVDDEYPRWPARINRWWEYRPNGPRAFSMDIAYTGGSAVQKERMVHCAPDGLPAGMNVVSVEGAGGWQATDRCTAFGGNRPDGCWQYISWTYLMMPKDFEVLFTEWNYTYNWRNGGVFSIRNGRPGASYARAAELGLVVWP